MVFWVWQIVSKTTTGAHNPPASPRGSIYGVQAAKTANAQLPATRQVMATIVTDIQMVTDNYHGQCSEAYASPSSRSCTGGTFARTWRPVITSTYLGSLLFSNAY